MPRQPKTPVAEPPSDTRLARVVEHIVSTTPPCRLFELYYWAQEPRLLKLIRSVAMLEPGQRDALISFFELAVGAASVSTRWGPHGELILEAKHDGDNASLHRYLIEDQDPLDTQGPKSH
jgi:hypothetical protein